jgi:hypothetical protein
MNLAQLDKIKRKTVSLTQVEIAERTDVALACLIPY